MQMKKAGLHPDETTMTTLLAGIASCNPIPSNGSEKCINLWKYWLAGSNPTLAANQPDDKDFARLLAIIVKSKKWDAFWQVVSEAPETGPLAPNASTYALVLEAIEGQMMEAKENEREEHVLSALRVWNTAMERHMKFRVVISDLLAVRMAKVLVASSNRKVMDAVFDLIRLTMGIPRFDGIDKAAIADPSGTPDKEVMPSLATQLRKSFPSPESTKTRIKIRPSVYMLNAVLEACSNLRLKRAASYYNNRFHEAGVPLDRVNLSALLRVYRTTRSAEDAFEAVDKYVASYLAQEQALAEGKQDAPWNGHQSRLQPLTWGTFRIAISTCGRLRKEGGGAIEYANRLYKLRTSLFGDDVDLKLLKAYMVCVDVATDEAQKTIALQAISRDFAEWIENGQDLVSKEKTGKPFEGKMSKQDIVDLAKQIIGHIDKQVDGKIISIETAMKMKPLLSDYVFQWEHNKVASSLDGVPQTVEDNA
jgi:hypothetical protein